MRDKKTVADESESRKRRYTEQSRERARERFSGGGPRNDDDRAEFVGLGSSNTMSTMRRRDDEDEEDDDFERRRNRRSAGCKRFLQNLAGFGRSG